MQPDEEPLLAVAGIWDSGKEDHSTPCEVIVTNRRLLGFYTSRISRARRLFLEQIDLKAITAVSLRQKTYEPIFRELLVSDGKRKVYIRAPRRYIEALFAALRETIEQVSDRTNVTFDDEPQQSKMPETSSSTINRVATSGNATSGNAIPDETTPNEATSTAPAYGRQDVRAAFDRSPLAILLLFIGGLIIEVIGFVLWGMTGSLQVGIPLFAAGIFAVMTAIFLRRRRTA
jgi:hypothetical protein